MLNIIGHLPRDSFVSALEMRRDSVTVGAVGPGRWFRP
jgi:hypothetical protein